MKVVQNPFAQLDLDSLKFPFAVPSLAAALCLAFAGTAAFGATTYTWNHSVSGNWQTAANWTPTRTTPATDDILQFNDGTTTTVTNVPTQTIGKMQVSGSTIVNLQSTNTAGLTNSAAASDALTVDAGSQLNINGATVLNLVLPTGST